MRITFTPLFPAILVFLGLLAHSGAWAQQSGSREQRTLTEADRPEDLPKTDPLPEAMTGRTWTYTAMQLKVQDSSKVSKEQLAEARQWHQARLNELQIRIAPESYKLSWQREGQPVFERQHYMAYKHNELLVHYARVPGHFKQVPPRGRYRARLVKITPEQMILESIEANTGYSVQMTFQSH
jgi:hypothetical protein